MEYNILKTVIDQEHGIAMVTISRPEAMNALNSDFFAELKSLVDSLKNNADLKVIIFTGAGKAFIAGADIAEMANMTSEEAYKFSRKAQEIFDDLEALEIPVIAAVNGFALGGGCEFAMACDFRIASSKAKFGQPEVNLGLIPGFAGTQRLSRLTNLADALFLVCSGEFIPASDALRIGLVQKVVEPEELIEYVMELAKKIASKGPVSVKKSKSVIRKGFEMNFKEASEFESKEFGDLFGKEESSEGMKAFLEKRNPNWNK